MSMRVLIGAHRIADYTGSELYVHELARALKQRDMTVGLFCLFSGSLARSARTHGIQVFDASNMMGIKHFGADIVHSHHVTAFHLAVELLPGVPIVHGILGALPELEQLPAGIEAASRIIVVSERLRDLVSGRTAHPLDIELVRNWFDDTALVERPRGTLSANNARHRVLVISNNESTPRDDALRELTRRGMVSVTRIGGAGRQVAIDSSTIAEADLVITMGRTVLLAAAAEVPVIVADQHLSDGLLTIETIDRLAPTNFTGRAFRHAITADHLWGEILRSKTTDLRVLARKVQAEYRLSERARQFVEIYRDVLSAPIPPHGPPRGEGLAYLRMAREMERLRWAGPFTGGRMAATLGALRRRWNTNRGRLR
jgi:hypothetical protein